MSPRWTATALASLSILVAIGLYQTRSGRSAPPLVLLVEPPGVMGTSCRLIAVADRHHRQRATEALDRVTDRLRRMELLMSDWIDGTEISRLNRAAAGQAVSLSAETSAVLRAARAAHRATSGAFDVTCRPLVQLWREAARQNQLPSAAQIAAARAASQWDLFTLETASAWKSLASATVDLGGIAKGFAIDRAVEQLQQAGLAGGLVDVGGDIRLFGRPPTGNSWLVQIRDPFRPGIWAEFPLREGAVCTSGNYARPVVIAEHPYSHIIDPHSGWPAAIAASVTVVAPTAETADVWATALSVLGEPGLRKLPPDTHALLILGTAAQHKVVTSEGFEKAAGVRLQGTEERSLPSPLHPADLHATDN